jgi:hypothetical protein
MTGFGLTRQRDGYRARLHALRDLVDFSSGPVVTARLAGRSIPPVSALTVDVALSAARSSFLFSFVLLQSAIEKMAIAPAIPLVRSFMPISSAHQRSSEALNRGERDSDVRTTPSAKRPGE